MLDREIYQVNFTPLDPYFFGNEQDFSKSYFIKSESLPMSSTIMGALRYLALPHKKHDFHYTSEELAENHAAAGATSFMIDATQKQDFGRIRRVSPVFLTDGIDDYVRTPFDHRIKNNEGALNEVYTPFSEFVAVVTGAGCKQYTNEYDPKIGLSASFMRLRDGAIVQEDDIIHREVRVGIAKKAKTEGFFKKEYAMLKDGWSFAVYVETSDGKPPFEGTDIALVGRGKSAFSVSAVPAQDYHEQLLGKLLPEGRAYFRGDTKVNTDVYDSCLWAAVGLRQYRSFVSEKTETGAVLRRGEVLYRMICAGSVMICSDSETLMQNVENENLQQIGFNQIVFGRAQG